VIYDLRTNWLEARQSQLQNPFPEKTSRPQRRKNPAVRAALVVKLGFFLFLRGVLGLGGERLGGALLEFVHAAGGIHEFLRARVKRMAGVANADDDGLLGGTRLDDVATGATNLGVHIFRMNVRFHKKGCKPIRKMPDDKSEFWVGRKNSRHPPRTPMNIK
jgi:hypothetical protein